MANKLTLRTYSGLEINPSDPNPENIELVDIAVSLSRVNRYVGHTRFPYSVAQHSVLCSDMALAEAPHLAMHCLFHDAAEAFTSDIPTPVKALLKPAITEIEDRFDAAVYERFKLTHLLDAGKQQVKYFDEQAYLLEKDQLRHEAWTVQHQGRPNTQAEIIIPRLTADEAALAFIRQYTRISRR
jgi:5'-deoxynucleotidase YfbR-like HD superfamily hydrolase